MHFHQKRNTKLDQKQIISSSFFISRDANLYINNNYEMFFWKVPKATLFFRLPSLSDVTLLNVIMTEAFFEYTYAHSDFNEIRSKH